jgi:hypothetical protein
MILPPFSLAIFSTHHHVTLTLHTPTVVPDTSLDDLVHRTRQDRDAQTRPGRAHARQSAHGERRGRVWPRRRPSASVDPSRSSLRQTLHDTALRRPDNAIGPRERRSRRPSRRRPPRVLPLPSCVRAHLCIVFNAVKRCVTARTSPTRVRQRQSITAAVAPSSMVRSSMRRGHLALL